MEGSFLQATQRRSAGDTVRAPSARFFIEPPILGLLFLKLDIALFAAPGLLIANRIGLLASGSAVTMQAGLALCLATAFFFATATLPSLTPAVPSRGSRAGSTRWMTPQPTGS